MEKEDNVLEKIILGAFARINFKQKTIGAAIKYFFPSCLFSLVYFAGYLLRHVFGVRSTVSLVRLLSRAMAFALIIMASIFGFLEARVLLGIKIGYITNIVCTILVFIFGVPLSQAKIAHGLSEQVKNHHYNWFVNLFRNRVAAKLKDRIKQATIIEMDAIMDEMIGPLLIAIEVLGAVLGALIPLMS